MGMRRVAIAAPGAGIGIYLTLHIVMPQGICFAVLVAIPAGTGMDGISALCAGGLDNSGRIFMGMGRRYMLLLGCHCYLLGTSHRLVGW